MRIIKIDKTKDTPSVHFNLKENVYEISGKSMPENASIFYKPLYDWISNFCTDHVNKGIQLDVSLDYLNSSSIKLVFLEFQQISEIVLWVRKLFSVV